MLLGWTVSRTHCFISEANLRGSLDRSHLSFRVHLVGIDDEGLRRRCLVQQGSDAEVECRQWLPSHIQTQPSLTDLFSSFPQPGPPPSCMNLKKEVIPITGCQMQKLKGHPKVPSPPPHPQSSKVLSIPPPHSSSALVTLPHSGKLRLILSTCMLYSFRLLCACLFSLHCSLPTFPVQHLSTLPDMVQVSCTCTPSPLRTNPPPPQAKLRALWSFLQSRTS